MYDKKPFTIEQQINQLRERGLVITETDNITHFLSHISYYRLAGYWWPMQQDKTQHIFKPNARFSDILALYNFDRELRVLLFDVIAKLEISLRTKLIYHLSHEFDPWWFQNFDIFQNASDLIKTLASLEEEITRSKDIFIKEHIKKHKDDGPPKAWIKNVPKAHEFQFLYIHLCCMKYLLNVIQPENTFTPRLVALFDKYPNVDPNALGMTQDWHNEDLWQ